MASGPAHGRRCRSISDLRAVMGSAHSAPSITKQPVSFWLGGLGVAINDRFLDLNEMREHLAD